MGFRPMPPVSAWTHTGVRAGFEVLFAGPTADGLVLRGHTTAAEGAEAWSVGYRIDVDHRWRTREVRVEALTAAETLRVTLERVDDPGGTRWLVDGEPDDRFDDCVDVDLESSAVTNTLPVHRLDLRPGRACAAPALFVRAGDLSVEPIEQEYRLREHTPDVLSLDYTAATFDFACVLTCDASGLVLEYPGIAVRER
ncbi:putative glycolipid-binding domain-containing protein [Promicromonospora sp. NPDC090134]|uniref:putative glycolipid-binding domain-containing protein n=1 Tax=Promicromonospora sp. NPDC090134 TaxID=3364408 RepID=UPI003824C6AA